MHDAANRFQDVTKSVYVDNIHYNALGQRLITDRIADMLETTLKTKALLKGGLR
jgi:hypothetical protein